jgi:hypothetical protein
MIKAQAVGLQGIAVKVPVKAKKTKETACLWSGPSLKTAPPTERAALQVGGHKVPLPEGMP